MDLHEHGGQLDRRSASQTPATARSFLQTDNSSSYFTRLLKGIPDLLSRSSFICRRLLPYSPAPTHPSFVSPVILPFALAPPEKDCIRFLFLLYLIVGIERRFAGQCSRLFLKRPKAAQRGYSAFIRCQRMMKKGQALAAQAEKERGTEIESMD